MGGRRRHAYMDPPAGQREFNLLKDRVTVLEGRVDLIVAFLQLDPNVLAFGLGVDPNWTINNGLVPVVTEGSTGANPPTIATDIITINSPGFYDVVAVFGVDIISSNNTVLIHIEVNSVETGIAAGVEFSGGQSAPINQATARVYAHFDAGDEITFVATELGTADKLLLWTLSGGTAVQTAFDWEAINP
jgi:hypothetical protein